MHPLKPDEVAALEKVMRERLRTSEYVFHSERANRMSRSSRQPVRRYRHIRRRSIELLAVADEVESAIILACGLNGSGPAVRVDAAIYLRFDPNISQ